MDKYIGNKKAIIDEIHEFLIKKNFESGVFLDVFAGTTNVGQYFKQRGYSIVSNDINEMSYVLGMAYIKNNEFPKFTKLLDEIRDEGFVEDKSEIDEYIENLRKKAKAEKIFDENYFDRLNFKEKIIPLAIVLNYLNNLDIDNLNEEESLFFDYYCKNGKKSSFRSLRGSEGNRNYFTEKNAKKLGKILYTIKTWKKNKILKENEFYILLTCVIEEVTLNANVNGTFHDFNRKKLYPNALIDFKLKPIILNVYPTGNEFEVYRKDANDLYKEPKIQKLIKNDTESMLYIDPPYNFRQYSAYYHMLNFIAKYHEIEDVVTYANGFEFVRGQNMEDNFTSKYCYRDSFINELTDLIDNLKTKEILISYYDENNHWNHGEKTLSMQGRREILSIFNKLNDIVEYDENPYIIPRLNYQSRVGARKKEVDELLFYARR